jgi:hypothetical protein
MKEREKLERVFLNLKEVREPTGFPFLSVHQTYNCGVLDFSLIWASIRMSVIGSG